MKTTGAGSEREGGEFTALLIAENNSFFQERKAGFTKNL
jgi:hypothetical protein